MSKIENAIKAMFAAMAVTASGCLGVAISACVKNQGILDLADKNGYQEANAIYKQAEVEELGRQLASNEISAQKFQSEFKSIDNLSVDYYMTSDDVSQQAKEDYTILKSNANTLEYTAYSLFGAFAIATVATFTLLWADDRQNREDEEQAIELPYVN